MKMSHPTLVPVDSSAIRAGSGDGSTPTVVFRTNNKSDEHPHAPYAAFEGLMHPSSQGTCYNPNIRGTDK